MENRGLGRTNRKTESGGDLPVRKQMGGDKK